MTRSRQWRDIGQGSATGAYLPDGKPDLPQLTPFINAIGAATPGHDIHPAFVDWASGQIEDDRERALFRRMADRSGIAHRWSILPPTDAGGCPVDPGGFYAGDPLPSTAERMALYARAAPALALRAVADLRASHPLKTC